MDRTPSFRIAAFVLAFAISAVTLGVATPGVAVYVADRLSPPAGDAFERIAGAKDAVEVDILPGRIDVIGVRERSVAQSGESDRT